VAAAGDERARVYPDVDDRGLCRLEPARLEHGDL
jgi:hypothetical protein